MTQQPADGHSALLPATLETPTPWKEMLSRIE